LLPVLEAALGYKNVLPERKLRSLEEFWERFPEVKTVIVDGTVTMIRVGSRRVIRPCPSQLDPDVRVSAHPAPDVLGFHPAHVQVVVAAFMDDLEIFLLPILMMTISMVQVNPFVI
jgi:hypothetical protein